jgi:hypothetical protein
MQGLCNLLERGLPLACVALWLSLADCSGDAFQSATEGSGGGGAPSVAGSPATVGGDSGSAGSAGADDLGGAGAEPGGSSGSGGAVSNGCNCPSGSYCREASNDCFSCSSLSRLRFTPPERIATLSESGQGARFPRVGSTSTDLLYRSDGAGLRYTPDASTSAGTSVSSTDSSDSAPLLLDAEVTGLAALPKGFNLLFDRSEPGAARALYFARWNGGIERPARAPEPFNSDLGDYSMAVALHPMNGVPARAFWMSARDATEDAPAPELLTAELTLGARAEVVTLKIGQPDCDVADSAKPDANIDPDLTPWVTSRGGLLLISTTRLEPDCSVSNQKKDIHAVLLSPETGQALDNAAAEPLSDVNSSADDTDPSFSADLCELYFASNRDGKFAVYHARRR